MVILVRSVLALAALLVSLLLAGPVVDRINRLWSKVWYVLAAEVVVTIVFWLSLLLLLRVI